MIKMGNENDALDLLQANYEAVKEQMDAGARGIECHTSRHSLGVHCYWEFEDGWVPLDMLDEVVDGLKDDELLLDPVLTRMGSMYSALGKLEDSMLAYRRSLEILEREYGKNSTSLITPLLGMAKVLGSIRRTTKVVEVYHCVITILELSKGAESEDLVVPLLGLGNLLMKEGEAMDAENPFLWIMSTPVLKDSKCMPLDSNVMEKIRIDCRIAAFSGKIWVRNIKGKEGRELLEECFITEKYRGKEHSSLVSHLYAEAEQVALEVLRIQEKAFGEESLPVVLELFTGVY
ncbi:hypothetical protein HYC85_003246 [Camellia sinensis]|uniref:Uncharacterized protein n=1 Tax=Camellia sinensis TaxID=4442 RepID=A0A7J7IBT2_CAMSI|nr:hypothetical protein HYC85_003246 [Camellia sinensis]